MFQPFRRESVKHPWATIRRNVALSASCTASKPVCLSSKSTYHLIVARDPTMRYGLRWRIKYARFLYIGIPFLINLTMKTGRLRKVSELPTSHFTRVPHRPTARTIKPVIARFARSDACTQNPSVGWATSPHLRFKIDQPVAARFQKSITKAHFLMDCVSQMRLT